MKEAIFTIAKNKHKIMALSILGAITTLVLVFVILPVILAVDPITVLVSITIFVIVGLVSVWADRRFTAKNGDIPRGYV